MKTIVLATDFSTGANRAAHVAAQLARAQSASLVLVHVFHFWPANPPELNGDFPLSATAMRDEGQQAISQLAHELHSQYGAGLPIRSLVREGYVIPTIQEITRHEKADLLVMSTVGSAPQSAQLMGSIASAMVSETNVPLLLIPPSAGYAAIKNIVLAVDLNNPPDAIVLETALRFARQFDSVVNMLSIHERPSDETVRSRAEHLRRLLASVPHTLTILPGDAVYETLLTFAHTNKADLIMMLPQPHNWFVRLFSEGNTERMARLTDIPLLAVV